MASWIPIPCNDLLCVHNNLLIVPINPFTCNPIKDKELLFIHYHQIFYLLIKHHYYIFMVKDFINQQNVLLIIQLI